MKIYDWIVIGAGITGASLSYELAKKGFSVLLLEQSAAPENATRFSYGGVAYWAGTTELTRQLCDEGIAIHRTLSQELEGNTQFRELDLLLTLSPDDNREEIADSYANVAIPPRWLSVKEACDLEPLLNPEAIAGALTWRYGHVQPEATALAYCQAFKRAGGAMQIAKVVDFLIEGDRIGGVVTTTEKYRAANVAVCAGGIAREMLKAVGISTKIYFSSTEILETPPVYVQLRTIVMPASLERFQLEARASTPEAEKFWDERDRELTPPILDAGAIQMLDGRIRIGQISRALSNPHAKIDPAESEAAIRGKVGQILPALADLPATWHQCLVSFCPDRLPSVGAISGWEGIHLFSGFSNPMVFVPPLARRFANYAAGFDDEIIPQLLPDRFFIGAPLGNG